MSTGAREEHKTSGLGGNDSVGEESGACGDTEGVFFAPGRPRLSTSGWLWLHGLSQIVKMATNSSHPGHGPICSEPLQLLTSGGGVDFSSP